MLKSERTPLLPALFEVCLYVDVCMYVRLYMLDVL